MVCNVAEQNKDKVEPKKTVKLVDTPQMQEIKACITPGPGCMPLGSHFM